MAGLVCGRRRRAGVWRQTTTGLVCSRRDLSDGLVLGILGFEQEDLGAVGEREMSGAVGVLESQ
jgi:hypothetical protein